MSGHRQAALALYALSAADQDLILAELPEADQAQLRAYLGELEELGFDDALAAPALSAARLFSLAPRAPATAHERVRAASAVAMAVLLGDEPAGLVAQVLGCDQWPWHGELLELLHPARRAQVRRALDERAARPTAPACAAVLIESIAARLERADPVTPAPAARSGLANLLNKATAWTR